MNGLIVRNQLSLDIADDHRRTVGGPENARRVRLDREVERIADAARRIKHQAGIPRRVERQLRVDLRRRSEQQR